MFTFTKKLFGNKVFQNFSYLTIGSVVSQLFSLFIVLKITRILSPGDYGVYTFIMMQGALLLLVGDLGLRYIVIRSIAREPERTMDLTVNGAILRTIALASIFGLYLLYNYFFGFLNAKQLLFVLLYGLISCPLSIFDTIFLGHQKMFLPSLVNIGYSIIWFVIIIIQPVEAINVNVLLLIYLMLNLIKAAVLFLIMQSQQLLKGKVGNFWTFSRGILKESWPYFVIMLIALPFTKFSNNFLDLNSTIEEVGYFNLSERLLGPISMVMDFALAALFPNLSLLWNKDKTQFNSMISEGFQYYMILGILLCFLFTLFARDVVTFLFTEKYLPAVRVCQLQIWFLFLSSMDYLIGTILGAVDKEKTILKLGIVRAIFSTPILYYCSKYGALGLSYGFVTAFGIYEIYLWYTFKNTLKINIMGGNRWWMIGISLFLVSYFVIQPDTLFLYRIVFALVVGGGIVFYIWKSYKHTLIKIRA